MPDIFKASFTQQRALPIKAVEAAHTVLENARIHRYGAVADELSEAAILEQEYAKWQGAKYCLACASGGQAMQVALRALKIQHNEPVLTNGFTLAPVPGAIAAVGAKPVLVEINDDLVIDCDDLDKKAKASGARILLLSHMRGHLADMDLLVEVCKANGVTIVEDCAHTMGATWDGIKSGNFGHIACFSTQTYKHVNSGEGGLLTTNDPDVMARAIILSGSYMNYARHGAAPEEKHFDFPKYECPNMSARMDNLRASILSPQIDELDEAISSWNERHDIVANILSTLEPIVALPKQHTKAVRVGSSLQFRVPNISQEKVLKLLEDLAKRGVELKWFGRDEPAGFTSMHQHWTYVEPQELPVTDKLLEGLFDIRLPLSFSLEECHQLGEILLDELKKTAS
ncbi:MAG: DegT/DnrJ/EryC1/StrS family aminotransferase [Nitratireductor sp.]